MGEPKYVIDSGYLCEDVGHHTCGTGINGHYGAHEPGCGVEPIEQIERLLRGWSLLSEALDLPNVHLDRNHPGPDGAIKDYQRWFDRVKELLNGPGWDAPPAPGARGQAENETEEQKHG